MKFIEKVEITCSIVVVDELLFIVIDCDKLLHVNMNSVEI